MRFRYNQLMFTQPYALYSASRNIPISRRVFKIVSTIYDEVFCENSERLKAVNNFRKKALS